MTTDLVIKSYQNDFEWLKYALRSIQRFATGFRKVIVIVPRDQNPPTGVSEQVFYVHEYGSGYLFQQVMKLHADGFSDAEFLVHLDSDTIFTRPISPDLIIADNRRPLWLYTPYASLGNDESQLWKGVTEKALMRPVENEFMRRHAFCTPRWALEGFRKWFWEMHGMSLERYVMTQPAHEFSEFNCLGAWLWFYHREKIEWINTDENMGTTFVHQHYSYGGLNDDIRANIERALA